ncbi:MAG: hypothetical protein E7576_08435 [Ruminococcaceae bacterium]|jgi:hypothetical protein|nr:hypothetical protein [Oscillospiraceae bacterium]
MIMNKFPIGFWNYTRTGDLGPEAVKDWADLGMTFALSPEYYDGCDKEAMLGILDACAERDIKVIVSDHRARWWSGETAEECEAQFKAAYEDFGRHPATLGFHIGDEPTTPEKFEAAARANRIQLKIAPELTPHLNFLPYWQGQEESILHAPTFEDWVERFTAESGLKILCYDCYVQMNPEEEGTHQYFTNLRKFAAGAEAAGIEPWTTLLSVGHFRYRVPSEDDLRWQLNTAVASGMKGILWFFVYEREPVSNYRLPPIDEFGERTETFARLSRVNRHFLHQFGDLFLRAEHLGTFHTVKSYGGYPLFEAGKTDDVLTDVTCDQGLAAVVGFFREGGDKYVAVVNNSVKESGLFVLHVPKDTKTFERFTWNRTCVRLKDASWDACYYETDTELCGGDWLAPGQMKVYRIGK